MNRREGHRFYYLTAAERIIGSDLAKVHAEASAHAQLALAEEDKLFGPSEQRIAALEAEIESLRKLTGDLGEELNGLRAEVRDHEDVRATIAAGYEDLAQALWGDEPGRPLEIDIGTLACWRQLRDRHVAQMAKAASLINAGRGAVAHELAETQKLLAVSGADNAEKEKQLQTHERILDSLWETVHPGEEQDGDAEPEELARQICEKWADLGREQQQKDREVEAASEVTLDGLAGLQRRVRELGEELRAGVLPGDALRDYADIFPQAAPAEAAGCSCGAQFATTAAVDDHECPLASEPAVGKYDVFGDERPF